MIDQLCTDLLPTGDSCNQKYVINYVVAGLLSSVIGLNTKEVN